MLKNNNNNVLKMIDKIFKVTGILFLLAFTVMFGMLEYLVYHKDISNLVKMLTLGRFLVVYVLEVFALIRANILYKKVSRGKYRDNMFGGILELATFVVAPLICSSLWYF